MADEKDQQALRLFIAAADLQQIRDKLGFRSTATAEAAIRRALKANRRGKTRDRELDTELERIDALYRAAYPLALRGDLAAIETCGRLSDRRLRILDKPDETTGLLAEYERTVTALGLPETDIALVAAGRAIARQIDDTIRHGTGTDITKVLYLVPHLMNVLRELGATPAARAAVQTAAGKKREPEKPREKSEFEKFREMYAR